jgi:uncharacterized alpha-E superfamily protein
MLARHAEDLFWIGRYLERAENTVRMVDVTYHAVLESYGTRAVEELWAELAEVLFLEDEIARPDAGLGPLLIADESNPASVMWLLRRARDNARTTREWLSAEFWEAINGLLWDWQAADLGSGVELKPYDVFRVVKAGLHTLTGVAEATMPRAEGYQFFDLGRMIERASLSTRVLAVWHRRLGGFSDSAAFTEWVVLLKSLAAYEAYIRAHRASLVPERVLEFLLRSPELPRSVHYTLTRVESHLSELAAGSIGQRPRRAVGRLRSSVEFAEPAYLDRDQLAEFLDATERAILELARMIEAEYFQVSAADATLHAYEAF